MNDTIENAALSRRGLLAGLGVAGAAGAAGAGLMVGAGAAEAAPRAPRSAGRPHTSPITSTLASPLIPGHQYVVRGEWDFSAEASAAQRIFGGEGVYTTTAASELWTSVDVPTGAQVFDIEWYVYNVGASPASALGRLWQPASGYLGSVVGDAQIPVTSSGVTATRVVVAGTSNGPYPTATKLMLGVAVATDGSVQVNGVRVGFTNAPMGTVLLGSPVRLYDSRAHSPIKSSQVRTHSIAGHVPPGAGGALVAVTVFDTHGTGSLGVGANGSGGSVSVARWARTGDSTLGQVASKVSTSQKISVRSRPGSGAADYTLDLVGYLA